MLVSIHTFLSSDEAFDDDEINISNNSMGVPLNYSTSSEESFAIPRYVIKIVCKKSFEVAPLRFM